MMEKNFKKQADIMYGAILGDIIGSCKQSSKISQNSPESIPLQAVPEGGVRHKVYQSCVVSL